MATEMDAERQARRAGRRRVVLAVIVIVLFVLLLSLRGIVGLYTDYLWYEDIGREDVWTSILGAQIVLVVVFVALFFTAMWVNLYLADRNAPPLRPPGPEEDLAVRWHDTVGRRNGLVRYLLAGVLALFSGSTAASQWNEWLLFTNRISFGVDDPVFGEDIGFYIFRLPFLTYVVEWGFWATFVMLLVTGGWYWLNGGIRVNTIGSNTRPAVKAHVSVLLALLALFKAADYWLDRYALLNSRRGFAQGGFYTDLNASLPATELLFFISLFSVVLFVANIFRRGWNLPAIAVALWALVALVAGGIYPAAIQALQVSPSEEATEAPYISRNIEATREAFGLSNIVTGEFNYTGEIDRETLFDNRDVFANVRLLDPRVVDDSFTLTERDRDLFRTFSQRVDVDRYTIDGELTPVVIGVRQLGTGNSGSWERRHAVQTHGYGVVVAPANQFDETGQPNVIVGDAPLESRVDEIIVDQPQIYFSDSDHPYALVNTTQNEFDFIPGFSYDGEGGLAMDSFWRRFAFAVRFGEIEPLISAVLTDETEILFVRNIEDRVRRVAPFLHYDSNPYPVIVDGGVSYVVDGYTTAPNYPYSQAAPQDSLPGDSDLRHDFNYVRNSVKAVVDAYDGTVDLYVVDPDDPILRSYRQAFPDLFKSLDEMPDEIRDHLRYPEDLFRIQTEHWGLYQLDEVSEFYTPNFGWGVALNSDSVSADQTRVIITTPSGTTTATTQQTRLVDPYYQVTRLPDESEASFVLARAFVPRSRSGNIRELTAYFAGRVDRDGRPELRQYVMSTGNNVSVRGPAQANEDLNADAVFSEERTQLDQSGSQFLAGNLMVLLVDDAVVYVRPYYVRAEPEDDFDITEPLIEFVAVVYENELGFAPTYAEAMAEVFDLSVADAARLVGDTVVAELPPETLGDPLSPADEAIQQRLEAILEQFNEAERALPDFARYDELYRQALLDLEQLLAEIEAGSDVEPADDTDDDPASA